MTTSSTNVAQVPLFLDRAAPLDQPLARLRGGGTQIGHEIGVPGSSTGLFKPESGAIAVPSMTDDTSHFATK